MKNAKVAIIGGGIGGLAALNELSRYGAEPSLYEASDRVGGRICTADIDGEKVEMGASFFLDKYHGFLQLADEMGLRPKRYPREKGGYLKGDDVIAGPSFKNITSGDIFSLLKLYISGWNQIRKGSRALQAYHDSVKMD